MQRSVSMVFALILVIGGVGQAMAGNLITNGGFETGDFTGWTVTHHGDTPVEPDGFVYGGLTYHSHSGNYFAALGSDNQLDTLSQTLTMSLGNPIQSVCGLPVMASRRTNSRCSGTDHSFRSNQYSCSNGIGNRPIRYKERGATPSRWSAGNVPGFLSLDDVSVTSATSAVPEPASLTLLARRHRQPCRLRLAPAETGGSVICPWFGGHHTQLRPVIRGSGGTVLNSDPVIRVPGFRGHHTQLRPSNSAWRLWNSVRLGLVGSAFRISGPWTEVVVLIPAARRGRKLGRT